METATSGTATGSSGDIEAKAYMKVAWRLLPLLFACYIVAYLDRVNVGFAKLQMLSDLKFSEAMYGLGAGIFFLGYFIFEVPSNLILHRMGARKWIFRIMVTWGLLSAGMAFVKTPESFYIMRLLLGIAEAGFFPGMILYLTYWFPSERRAHVTALFMTAVPLSGVIGGPLSGWILHSMAGVHGWAGWQWLFVLEGLPSVFLGFLVLKYLDDGIDQAKWLNAREKSLLASNIRNDAVGSQHASLRSAMSDSKVWILSAIYFCVVIGLYGISFWLPSIIRSIGVQDPLQVGFLSAIPYGVATIGMVVFGRSADVRRERRWHLAFPCILGAAGLIAATQYGSNVQMAMFSLSIASLGIISALPLFWSCPTAILRGTAAAGGIAFINSVGNLAGFASTYFVGLIKDFTGKTDNAMYMLAAFLVIGAILTITFLPARLVNR